MNLHKYVVASLIVLAGCASQSPTKLPGARVEGNVVSFEGCNFKIAFSGAPRPFPIDVDELVKNSSLKLQRSDILELSAFQVAEFNFLEVASCSCTRYPIEAMVNKFTSAESMQRGQSTVFREGVITTSPTNWQEGTVFGKMADYEIRSIFGNRYAKATYLGNCEGYIIASRSSQRDEAKAKAFVESIAPLKVTLSPESDSTSTDRLRILEKLRDEKLITEKEYQERRKAIIDRL